MHLYLHIPFCKQACHYCDFHFSTNLKQKGALVNALCQEIEHQQAYLPTRQLETVYFGGGTPSLLSETELGQIVDTIHRYFTVAPDAEITLEANPDDLNTRNLSMLRRYVNRLSIGIQTFDASTLRWMNRAHNAIEAETCVQLAQDTGFTNISIDLIYGIQAEVWERDLTKALALLVPHISAYALTIEPDTAFGRWQQKGKLTPVDEELAAEQFQQLVAALTATGYVHYEISNLAQPGYFARHNSAYWKRRPYLGIGPSAHSYNGHTRHWNIANNASYIKAIEAGELPHTLEELTTADQVNDYLLTGLRTIWGCSLQQLSTLLEADFYQLQQKPLMKLQQVGWLVNQDGILRLTEAGKLFADRVAAELFVEE